jgi:hypothetical protein
MPKKVELKTSCDKGGMLDGHLLMVQDATPPTDAICSAHQIAWLSPAR